MRAKRSMVEGALAPKQINSLPTYLETPHFTGARIVLKFRRPLHHPSLTP